MGQNSSISFKVADTGVSSFIEKIKRQSSQLTAEMIVDAQKQTASSKEQLRLIEQKIVAMSREARLNSAAAESAIRQTAQQRIITSQARVAALEDENKRKYRAGEITSSKYYSNKKRIGKLGEEFSEQNITSSSEDKIRDIKEQFKQQQLQVQYAKQAVDAIRTGSQQQVMAIKQGDTGLSDAIEDMTKPEKDLIQGLTAEQQKREKVEKERITKDGEYYKNNMLSLANGVALDRVGSMAASMPQAKNELDYIKPMMATMGMLAGGISGNIIDAMEGTEVLGNKLGQTNFGQLGTQLGEKVGEFAGASLERTYKSRDELQTSNFKLKALAGGGIGDVEAFGSVNPDGTRQAGTGEVKGLNQNLEKFGLSLDQVSRLQYEIALRQGDSKNLGKDAQNYSAFQQAWGVRDETSLALLEEARANKGGDKDIANIITGIYEKGSKNGVFKDGDRAFLNEFIAKNYLQLQKTLLTSSNSVNSGTVMDILTKFNSVGGQFTAKDPRSQGLINTIQSSLANPGTDAMKALAFTVMRKDHPELNMVDTQIEMQKGLGSKKYLQSMMKYLTSQGGGESYQVNNIASAFGLQGNLAAAKDLYTGYKSGKFGTETSLDLLKGTGEYSVEAANKLGGEQTSVYAQSTAEIQNAFIKSAVDGIATVSAKMTGLFGTMIDGLEEYVRDRITKSISGDNTEFKGNKTKRPIAGGGTWSFSDYDNSY